MQLIIQKYGGTSLSDPDRIRRIAARIAERAHGDTGVVVIVSAMGQTTDELTKLAHEITPRPSQRELDMLLTVGERISMALLSMALNAIGCEAISFTGSQGGIVTNVSHTRALIEEIRATRIQEALATGKVVIVAGFQGVSRAKEITTLGRGGSDTTAVALAATLGASACEIHSDVDGVYTADPRWVPGARPLASIDYRHMLELAALGARVLHYRAAEIARRYQVPLYLLSSFDTTHGTRVGEEDEMEKVIAKSVTCNSDVLLVRVQSKDRSTIEDLVARLGDEDIQMLAYQKTVDGSNATVTMLIDGRDRDRFDKLSSPFAEHVALALTPDVASVSIVGTGLACQLGAIARVEHVLSAAAIPVSLVCNSSHSITCVLPESDAKKAVEAIHSAFIAPGVT